MNREIYCARSFKFSTLNHTVLFHKGCKHTEEVLNIYTQIIVIIRQLIADGKVNDCVLCIRLHTNKTVTVFICINMAALPYVF